MMKSITRYHLGVLIVILVVVLSGCTPGFKDMILNKINSSQTQDSNLTNSTTNLNNSIEGSIDSPSCDPECEENQECVDGLCLCASGYTGCDGKCIAEDQCCGDADCNEGEVCLENTCSVDCETIFCPFNQACTAGECGCKEGTYWCEAQGLCIEDEKCCDGASCSENRRKTICTKMTLSAEICFEEGSTKSCKFVQKERTKQFFLESMDLRVKLTEIYEGPFFDIVIQQGDEQQAVEKIDLDEEGLEKELLDFGAVMWVESLSYQGGDCMRPD